MLDVTTTKVLIIFGLLIFTLLAALLPLFCIHFSSLKRRRRAGTRTGLWARLCSCCEASYDDKETPLSNEERRRRKVWSKRAMSFLNCFAGGIFLGTSFIGLLPEIREVFETFKIRWPPMHGQSGNPQVTTERALMPMAEIVITLGLFFILIVEQAAHGIHHRRHKRKKKLEVEVGETTAIEMTSGESIPDSSDDENKAAHEHQSIRSLLLVATLSVHSLLEGIAMGLQKDVGSVMAIFVAVLFHKSLMAFSMGTNLVKTKQSVKRIVAAALIFSLMSPAGISIGLIIKVTGGDSYVTTLVNVILQAVATGTFLYITFFEVLVAEFDAHGMRVLKVVALLLGYGCILGSIFAQHS